ncbi:conjugal transfer protein TraB (plasmid) [Bermanella marisrubri]|uniref:Uncharacterized protein n=1 Tax=Bermanella marisrubri TaxID=207949 RepID=Q1MXI4_9GAMM|nr:hypothetical protein [Bermanella marisrubri]EAT10688.1 hypothetical protein RED65_01888 [Oceanobacter sp. RED65] [Bermanella marisrubri]QIZ85904.1 conjugal transfer protein TraB [Bermanella marisrubri]
MKRSVGFVIFFALSFLALSASASTTGQEFQAFYDWVFGAATGFLGRGIAITAGIIGLAIGAGMGKAIPALMGVLLAIIGSIGPTIINSLFGSALI